MSNSLWTRPDTAAVSAPTNRDRTISTESGGNDLSLCVDGGATAELATDYSLFVNDMRLIFERGFGKRPATDRLEFTSNISRIAEFR